MKNETAIERIETVRASEVASVIAYCLKAEAANERIETHTLKLSISFSLLRESRGRERAD